MDVTVVLFPGITGGEKSIPHLALVASLCLYIYVEKNLCHLQNLGMIMLIIFIFVIEIRL